jgi:ribosomal protein S18 acetylase RimI-like enzyme
MGYIMGKAEGHVENWHGHVTALTVSPEFRRLGLAATLMTWLEDVSEKKSLVRGPVCPCIEPSCNQHVQASWLHSMPNSIRILFW